MNQNMATMQSGMSNIICVRIEGDKLVSTYTQSPEVVGYTAKAYDEALSIAEEYRKVLVENGLLEEEKTPEEQLGSINQKMDTVLTMMTGFDARLSKLEEADRGHQQNHPDSGKGDRSRPKSSE